MAKAAQNGELKAAFEKHRDETEGQVERLDQVSAIIDKKPQGKTCAAIVGITEEGAEIMQDSSKRLCVPVREGRRQAGIDELPPHDYAWFCFCL